MRHKPKDQMIDPYTMDPGVELDDRLHALLGAQTDHIRPPYSTDPEAVRQAARTVGGVDVNRQGSMFFATMTTEDSFYEGTAQDEALAICRALLKVLLHRSGGSSDINIDPS